ncbi:nuclear transport factor 2 family protein [Streptomyces misionensis]|uniref:Nuclear transport factor 2 family protein n=1 Tax=Streptomyces misionensis TaxID=67331 RepID=A0A5C6JU40_9ACTN|nr:nuclear transport factor 2 family protein [Streptomyces misionensis]TWV45613.1 nuclear transport factor 2 family protein [Streptomyces misionensis]
MSTMQSMPAFDVEALRRGIEERDVATMRGLYAENAQMTVVDRRDQPSHPHQISGASAIGEFLEELCSRDMEHRLEQVVVSADGSHAAYLERCRYPDDTTVLATSMLDLRDGRITAQTSLQEWDEESGGARPEAAPTAAAEAAERVEHLDFSKPDEVRTFGHGRAEIFNVGGGVIGRLVLEPGWRWSEDVKPLAGTEWCEAPHFQYHVSGTIRVHMADGTEFDAKAGDLTLLPSGHDAWVIGDETVVVVDWQGAVHYAEKP